MIISEMRVVCGNSTWNHMPGVCAAALSHRTGGVASCCRMLAAVASPWLAVTRQDARSSGAGTAASSSACVNGCVRVRVARMAATCSGVMMSAELPNALRTNDATSAIHSSVFDPIATMTP